MFLQTGLLFLSQRAFGGEKKKKPTFALFFLTTQSFLGLFKFQSYSCSAQSLLCRQSVDWTPVLMKWLGFTLPTAAPMAHGLVSNVCYA